MGGRAVRRVTATEKRDNDKENRSEEGGGV